MTRRRIVCSSARRGLRGLAGATHLAASANGRAPSAAAWSRRWWSRRAAAPRVLAPRLVRRPVRPPAREIAVVDELAAVAPRKRRLLLLACATDVDGLRVAVRVSSVGHLVALAIAVPPIRAASRSASILSDHPRCLRGTCGAACAATAAPRSTQCGRTGGRRTVGDRLVVVLDRWGWLVTSIGPLRSHCSLVRVWLLASSAFIPSRCLRFSVRVWRLSVLTLSDQPTCQPSEEGEKRSHIIDGESYCKPH